MLNTTSPSFPVAAYQDPEQLPNGAAAIPLIGAVLETIQEVTVGSVKLSDAVEHSREVIRRYHGL